ncbi:MAG TPA: GatB/YqeY domain-containing protein [Prolixibacteraceae bacterium]|nr:GatB/YqeY domain-containing protein [Prolixibacteraceae bacterium]
MNLFDQISDDIRLAMLARDKERLEALRNVKKVLIEAKTAKAGGEELSDDAAIKAIAKLVKQGRDSAQIYKEQNRMDLYEPEMVQVKILEEYLPKQMDDAELTVIIKAIIEKTGATSIKEMGKVIGMASKELAGKADGRLISDKVKSLLT